MATQMPIDPEYGRFVQGIPDDASPEQPPEEAMEVEFELTDETSRNCPMGLSASAWTPPDRWKARTSTRTSRRPMS
jgi:hypothetical protein